MAAAYLFEYVLTLLVVKPSLSLTMQGTVVWMLSRISLAVTGHLIEPIVTVLTVVVGETEGRANNCLTVFAHARTGQIEGSPDLCMVTVFPIMLFFWRRIAMEME